MPRAHRQVPTHVLAVPAAIALLVATAVTPANAEDPAPRTAEQQKVAELEARIAELEAFLARTMDYGSQDSTAAAPAGELVLPVRVTSKVFHKKDPAHSRWEDYLNLDVEYDTTTLARPASAIKGTLLFSDPFGELRFEMPTLVSDIIEPGRPVRQKNIRFKFNQFRDAHQWMHGTDPKKMVVALHVTEVMYRDGTTQNYR